MNRDGRGSAAFPVRESERKKARKKRSRSFPYESNFIWKGFDGDGLGTGGEEKKKEEGRCPRQRTHSLYDHRGKRGRGLLRAYEENRRASSSRKEKSTGCIDDQPGMDRGTKRSGVGGGTGKSYFPGQGKKKGGKTPASSARQVVPRSGAG